MRRRLTKREIKQIGVMTRAGLSQESIARELHVTSNSIRRQQTAHGWSRWKKVTTEIKQQAIALLSAGTGTKRTARFLRIPESAVDSISQEYGICRSPGRPKKHFEDCHVALVHKVCDSFFAGKVPAVDDAVFANAILAGLAQTTFAGQSQAVLDNARANLKRAVAFVRSQPEARWLN